MGAASSRDAISLGSWQQPVAAARGSGPWERPVGAASSRDSVSLGVDDADELPVLRALLLEFDVTVFFREQGVIAAEPDIDAGVKTRATLTNNNITRDNLLATVDFDA